MRLWFICSVCLTGEFVVIVVFSLLDASWGGSKEIGRVGQSRDNV